MHNPLFHYVTILASIYYRFKGLEVLDSVLKGLRPAIIAMIATAGLSLFNMAIFGGDIQNGINTAALILFIAAFIVIRKWKTSPILIMIATGVATLIWGLI